MFNKGCRTCCFVTGASRGFGRAIAIELAQTMIDKVESGANGTIVLVARSSNELQQTKEAIDARQSSSVSAHSVVGDLGDMANIKETTAKIFEAVNPTEYSHALFVHNAGSLGDCSKFIRDLDDTCVPQIQQYWDLNLTSPLFLTAKFLQLFKHAKRYIVHISSLVGVQPFSSLSVYGTGKAARDMMFRAVATEESEVRVLNYAPGPLSTTMYTAIKENSADPQIREMFRNTEESKAILSTHQSAAKLVGLLESDKYTSGEHIDYYDI